MGKTQRREYGLTTASARADLRGRWRYSLAVSTSRFPDPCTTGVESPPAAQDTRRGESLATRGRFVHEPAPDGLSCALARPMVECAQVTELKQIGSVVRVEGVATRHIAASSMSWVVSAGSMILQNVQV